MRVSIAQLQSAARTRPLLGMTLGSRLVHITDPHLGQPAPVRARRDGLKRWLGGRNWHERRQHTHRPEQLQRLVQKVQVQNADLILVTGDLCQIGTKVEFEQARAWLEMLGAPERVLFVPGNHDVYASDSLGQARRALGPYLPAEFPCVRQLPQLQVIGLSTGIPTPLLSARGALGARQLLSLEALLNEGAPTPRIVALHHPPCRRQCGWRKALREVSQLEALLVAQRIPLVLHGHLHRNCDLDRGGVRVSGTASASAVDIRRTERHASFRQLDVEPSSGSWRAGMQTFTLDEAAATSIYSGEWFT